LFEYGQRLLKMDLTQAGESIRANAAAAAAISKSDVARAHEACEKFRKQVQEVLDSERADAIVTPTSPFPAPRLDEEWATMGGKRVQIDLYRNCFVRAANAIKGCAITLPAALYERAELPAGLHLMAGANGDPRLLAAARRIEAALPELPPAPPLRSDAREG
jgi:Asp-tRNA(Asn)/Glu-tRNA(Gln) amidotransferase A subunit family amidase